MMSKKKKDKADEPKKGKARSSKGASQQLTNPAGELTSVAVGESSVKPRRAPASRKKAPAVEISSDDIALRAYYLAERRRNLNLPGDEMGDWVEAERQLRKEAGKKST